MASTSNDRPRYRSSTIGSIQTLTRALRESLRLRKLRKKKRQNEASNEKMRRRSKSVGNASFDDEISEVFNHCYTRDNDFVSFSFSLLKEFSLFSANKKMKYLTVFLKINAEKIDFLKSRL
jgi:hypothetical protein